MPQFWQSWYGIVKGTFDEKEELGRDVHMQNVILDKRVMTRTAELEKTNEQLRVEIKNRENVEEALRESEESFRAILSASPNPMVIYDAVGEPQYINPAFTDVFLWTPGWLTTRP